MTTELDRKPHGTSTKLGAWALVLALVTSGQVIGSEHGCPEPGGCQNFLQRMSPAGGWHPDEGGLWHWWNPCCFPRCGGPDDYCRKPPPKVCWPPYPPYYFWGPPQTGCVGAR
jgi:hypothetical protein